MAGTACTWRRRRHDAGFPSHGTQPGYVHHSGRTWVWNPPGDLGRQAREI